MQPPGGCVVITTLSRRDKPDVLRRGIIPYSSLPEGRQEGAIRLVLEVL